MIIGVTHDNDGRVVQWLSVSAHQGLYRAATQRRLQPSHQARPLRLPAQEEVNQPG